MREERLLGGGHLIHIVTDYTSPNLGPNRPRKGRTLCGQAGSTWSIEVWGGGAPKTPCPKCHTDEDKT